MAEHVPDDILEKIMIGFDVKDLIRCKCVCKSWQSFITSSRFVKAHLNRSYNNDCNNNDFSHRRILIPRLVIDGKYKFYHGVEGSFVGSSNGLVCISPSRPQVLVANPLTREVKKLHNPRIPEYVNWSSLCWGFGYDNSTDDYKVIVGFEKGNYRTQFQVLSLKSNVWKVIGEVNYTCIPDWTRRNGTYCNGALHWFMNDHNYNYGVIISFDLSREEFKEIPQPKDARYKYNLNFTLGIFEECLCIFHANLFINRWVMKNYNVKESWAPLLYFGKPKDDVVYFMEKLENYNSHTSFFVRDCMSKLSWKRYLFAPVFVQSIVSPHVCRRLKRKTDECK